MIPSLTELQTSVQDPNAFSELADYFSAAQKYLGYLATTAPTRIISPSHPHYCFYQYPQDFQHAITRPINTNLFMADPQQYTRASGDFLQFLSDLRLQKEKLADTPAMQAYLTSGQVNQVVYTTQQSIGAIGDSFTNANQARKRIGQLFEKLIKLIIQQIGLVSEPRTVQIDIPGFPGYSMPYELDVVFSRDKAILTSESHYIHPDEIVGSIKTTSKDRIDKIFPDKYLLKQLLGRDIPVVAIFLHDVQRAKYRTSNFGIHSTFKTNHFLGYTVALNRLDGVYYVDPRPDMLSNVRLQEQIHDFQHFLVHDLWTLTTPRS